MEQGSSRIRDWCPGEGLGLISTILDRLPFTELAASAHVCKWHMAELFGICSIATAIWGISRVRRLNRQGVGDESPLR